MRTLLLATCCAWAATTAPAFAADLAPIAPSLTLSGGGLHVWRAEPAEATLRQIASAPPEQRQLARWRYARSLIAAGRPADAIGVLEVLLQDEPDLGLADGFALAHGRVLVELGRGVEAVAALERPVLAQNAEACAWRLRAFALAGANDLARQQMVCARMAIVKRSTAERTPFLIAAAHAAVRSGHPDAALHWLTFVAPTSAEAALVRGQALLASGQARPAAVQFEQALRTGNAEQKAEAEVGRVEAGLATGALSHAAAAKALSAIAYRWRGGPVERRALGLTFNLALHSGDRKQALRSAATLVRYHSLGAQLPPLLARVQLLLAEMLSPGGVMRLDEAAGLYWEYRDLAPGGAEGDLLALRLADRLQDAGLYARAADLMEHQLVARARDVAQGPLSVRVAKLRILAGEPQGALDALRMSAETRYPPAMLHERQRMEAVALQLLGRGGEALAVLQAVPGSAALQAELLWRQRSWAALAGLLQPNLPAGGTLSDLRQAVILRQAISLGMLGREEQLATLRGRYASAFSGLPSEHAFDMLTRPAGSIDAESLTTAMAAIPTVSLAGDYGDLLDAAPAPKRKS